MEPKVHTIVNLGYTQSSSYPYDYRVQMSETDDFDAVIDWVEENNIKCTVISNVGVLYLKKQDVPFFLMRWQL